MKIIYVLGSGRSGSTVLERVMATAADTVGVGEFHCFWRRPAHELLCSCGQTFSRCEFWTEVVRASRISEADLVRLRTLEDSVVRNKFLLQQRFSLARLTSNPQVKEFLGYQDVLLDAVCAVSGKTTIIDSSKAGPRGWIMALDDRVSFVHVTRQAQDVFPSWMLPKWDRVREAPMKQMSLVHAAFDWWRVEQSAAMLRKQVAIRHIDYAQFAHSPEEALLAARITGPNGLLGEIPWLDGSSVESPTDYHSLNGNPDRYDRGPIQIAFRTPRLEKLGRLDRIGVRLLGGLLDKLYP
ncbi:hypothetical protein [Nitrogeniibacter aestuarii]|uniref:hypothetical protein n=1 Tax=Nitrogeniibacter aestuarii TaxID=2815343 RepID=UPI001E57B099|nr:hypothetical protein [Nitrogeniibacter aestuarii]